MMTMMMMMTPSQCFCMSLLQSSHHFPPPAAKCYFHCTESEHLTIYQCFQGQTHGNCILAEVRNGFKFDRQSLDGRTLSRHV